MNATINRESLLSLFNHAMLAMDSKPQLPILENVLIHIENSSLTITGTNLNLYAASSAPIESADSAHFVVPGKSAVKIIKSLPKKSSVVMGIDGKILKLNTDIGQFSLPITDPEPFPIIPATTNYEYEADPAKLYNMLTKTIHAMAQKDCRPYLNGYRIILQNEVLTGIATDGHRLAFGHIPLLNRNKPKSGTIVHEGAKALAKMLKEPYDPAIPVQLHLASENHQVHYESSSESAYFLHIRHGSSILVARLIDGPYPDCDRVIPKTRTHNITISRKEMLDAIRKVTMLNKEKFRRIIFSFEEKSVVITGFHDDMEEKATISTNYCGKPFEVQFNARYWTDVLSEMDDVEIQLKMENNSNEGSLIESDGMQFVIMPMRM